MSALFGSTRSVVTPHYALITPPGFVSAPIPGWRAAESYIVVAPAIGARFAQLLLTLGPGDGGAGDGIAGRESFFFVREGAVTAHISERSERLGPGGFCYAPPGAGFRIEAEAAPAKLIVFERSYHPLTNVPAPEPVFGDEAAIAGAPFMGDEAAILKLLLPDRPDFDMAVNIFTFQPGATLPIVETHIMEHGLQMIQGQGIYRLASDWHPVQEGDVIWMAPYCPQWFVATGKSPARYIYYKDVNRHPLT